MRQRTAPLAFEIEAVLDALTTGDPARAEQLARSLTRRYPTDAFGWKALAAALSERGERDAALMVYSNAPASCGADWEFCNNFGNVLKLAARWAEAEPQYRRAAMLNKDAVEPPYNLGLLLLDQGRGGEAEVCLRAALTRSPQHALAHLNLANLLNMQGRLREAEFHYLQAMQSRPQDPVLLNNFGQLLNKQDRYAEAESCYRRALTVAPEYATAMSNLAELMANHGAVDDAVKLLQSAVAAEPEHASAHSNLLFTMLHQPDVEAAAITRESRAFAAQFEAPLLAEWTAPANERDPQRALRVGFVSADLRNHPVLRYLPAMLRVLRDHAADFTLVAYNNFPRSDSDTLTYRALFHEWHDVAHLDDAALAAQVTRDRIDVLFDLSGHTGFNRLLTFARKPAPVQISWLGYAGSTGLRAMDYAVGDEHVIPAAFAAEHFTEKMLYLPSATAFEPIETAPPVSDLPARKRGVFTFGCLARMNKLNAPLVCTWAKILERTPGTRLMLACVPDGRPSERVIAWFAEQGIAADRLVFAHPRSVQDVLTLYQAIDLALDTFPYGASTGTHHALWMGVPTVTLEGDLPTGRLSSSIAQLAGLEGLVAASVEDYVARACEWTQRLDELAALRLSLRERMRASVLTDAHMLGTTLAGKVREAWQRWCHGLPPCTM